MGSADGIIMATNIASHMSRKLMADANQVWPRIRIHIVDIVQPPGISITHSASSGRNKLLLTRWRRTQGHKPR